jgi:DtxR family Mn-dependent transcriptional regulator
MSGSKLTPSVEDYLKAVFRLSSDGGLAATSEVALALGLRPPSASAMLRRLANEGLVTVTPYQGAQLTPVGRQAALRIIRRHRIIELYLTRFLGYQWDAVHDEAERLEHAVSNLLIERMAAALGDPRYDPHGHPIPTADGEVEAAALVPLVEAPVGAELVLDRVETQEPGLLRFLTAQGLVLGTPFQVVGREPMAGVTSVVLAESGVRREVGSTLANSLLCREVAP